jgi:spore coat protein U-like protein
MLRVSRLMMAAAALALVLASPAAAQSSANASIQALAYVQGVAPLTALGVNDLDFGVVIAGTPTAPTNLANQAGRFDISGEPGNPVTVNLTLPLTLSGAGGDIPISFSTTDGLLWAPFPTSNTTFDPNVPLVTSLDASGNLTVGISGTVSPPASTTTGNYTATITLTVSYL